MFSRLLTVPQDSTLLLGPRATGKSTWLGLRLPDAPRFDLLNTALALQYAREPARFSRELDAMALEPGSWVIIDEIQKVPDLLDEVQRQMQDKHLRFVLSGSSARKLRRAGTNLLAGRALRQDFFPLVSAEIGGAPSLDRIAFGMLPRVLTAERPRPYLSAYAQTYVKEEVQAEALTRNIGGFARFLEVAARQNAMVTNVASIARDAQVARQTVQGYFEVLTDTLLGFWLPAYRPRRATKVVQHDKFYFFDAGVARALSGRLSYPPTPEELGPLFETYLLHELRAWIAYRRLEYPLYFFRTHDGVEVDVLLEDARGFVAFEFKSSSEFRQGDGKGFKRLRAELPGVRCTGVFAGSRPQSTDWGTLLPYGTFLRQLWDGDLIV
jgi:predicted AAA+ superfamily ATPase